MKSEPLTIQEIEDCRKNVYGTLERRLLATVDAMRPVVQAAIARRLAREVQLKSSDPRAGMTMRIEIENDEDAAVLKYLEALPG